MFIQHSSQRSRLGRSLRRHESAKQTNQYIKLKKYHRKKIFQKLNKTNSSQIPVSRTVLRLLQGTQSFSDCCKEDLFQVTTVAKTAFTLAPGLLGAVSHSRPNRRRRSLSSFSVGLMHKSCLEGSISQQHKPLWPFSAIKNVLLRSSLSFSVDNSAVCPKRGLPTNFFSASDFSTTRD